MCQIVAVNGCDWFRFVVNANIIQFWCKIVVNIHIIHWVINVLCIWSLVFFQIEKNEEINEPIQQWEIKEQN